jgi:hypothetical protein
LFGLRPYVSIGVRTMSSLYAYLLVGAFAVAPAVAGGWLGWWFGTGRLYVRILGVDPDVEEISRGLLLRRQVQRLLLAVRGAAIGAVAGLALLVFLVRIA